MGDSAVWSSGPHWPPGTHNAHACCSGTWLLCPSACGIHDVLPAFVFCRQRGTLVARTSFSRSSSPSPRGAQACPHTASSIMLQQAKLRDRQFSDKTHSSGTKVKSVHG